ncbi:hypothetical protein EUBVEN_01502 [Eubacterium ventriosum ATCC 27560]|uniref:Uncharacterized protein n=1 Tax=Eubacterium ventriosum ATCC 27560 TaxID=411463 RepID=A5Z720_9FIRM|nr:hypothetical protein EUBVEN_01502 [Eubacterium ventriosum ATCC 27560]
MMKSSRGNTSGITIVCLTGASLLITFSRFSELQVFSIFSSALISFSISFKHFSLYSLFTRLSATSLSPALIYFPFLSPSGVIL